MRPKSLILLALALGCGLVASIGISQVMDRSGDQVVGYETVPIYVALHNINLNDPIDGSMVTLQEWPKDKVPPGAVTQLEDLEGRRPRTLIVAGDAILEAKLLAQGEVHDPIGEIPSGMRLKTISVDAETSAAGLLSPGDRVDIQFFQVPKNGRGGGTPRMRVILQNIRVYAVDQTVQRSSEGGEGRAVAKTISLLLTPEQANKLSLAEQLGSVSLIPRSPDDEATTDATELSYDDLWSDRDSANTRNREQNRDQPARQEGTGFLGGLMTAMQRAANERPPFVMDIVEAENVRQMEFDSVTGKPLNTENSRPSAGSSLPSTTKPGPATPPSIKEAQEELEAEFPIDLELE
jgi:pilus assembly protein CpaB